MKKYLFLLIVCLCGVLAAGCSDDEDNAPVDKGIVGEWQLAAWSGDAVQQIEAYVDFRSDASFSLYQKFTTPLFVRYDGSYSTRDNLLSGIYTDGTPLGADYEFTLSEDGNTLTLTSRTSAVETTVYTRTSIPGDVRNAPVAPSMRSAAYRLL